jgi:zinc and cadmium transporter
VALTLLVQCSLIVVASLAGGKLPDWIELTHRRLQLMMSFVGGLMLGIALLHLLPHSATQLGSVEEAGRAMMVGMLTMFLMLRMFHFHEHEPMSKVHQDGQQHEPHEHDHDHDSRQHHNHDAAHRLSWGGVAVGLSLHTLIDGMALGAAVSGDARPFLGGLGVFLAILLHKPLDAVSITALMAAGGWSPRHRLCINTLFAIMCPAGALLFVFGVGQFPGIQWLVVGSVLGFSAGVFACIAMSDLLPEIEFHSHDRVGLSVCLVIGLLTAVGLTLL